MIQDYILLHNSMKQTKGGDKNPYFELNQDYILLNKIVKQTGSGGHNRTD